MKNRSTVTMIIIALISVSVFLQDCSTHKKDRKSEDDSGNPELWNMSINDNARDMMDKGKAVFRFETFGDEIFWTDKLQLHKILVDKEHGGLDKGLLPKE